MAGPTKGQNEMTRRWHTGHGVWCELFSLEEVIMITKHHDLVEIEGILVWETHKESEDEGAFLITTETKEKVWVPKASCTKTPHTRIPNRYIFEMPQNVAEDKGLV